MRFLHVSDLHIGKRVHEFSMIAEQKYILRQLVDISKEREVEALLIAGDIYDKTVPTVEAVDLFDDFITELVALGIKIFAISGNHDSPERIDYGGRIMKRQGVYIAGSYKGEIPKISLSDEHGALNIYLMPYLRPALVNKALDVQTKSFDEAVRVAISHAEVDESERNIILAHQFVTADEASPERSESETKSLGGTDNVDVSAFDAFDYVALGHIHRPQRIGRDTARYSGSPLKYSFSEAKYNKSVVLLDMNEKSAPTFELIPLVPRRDLVEIRCSLDDLKAGKFAHIPADTYMHITLTDEDAIVDAIGKVRSYFENVMLLDFDNTRSRSTHQTNGLTSDDLKEKTPLELFSVFYEEQNGVEMGEKKERLFSNTVEGMGSARTEPEYIGNLFTNEPLTNEPLSSNSFGGEA